ncbi:uncharacterized protein LOC131157185 [Malania oleifera]|uniref:uncharacterized protein LOC131157185 n=1 Tax=Malania oleifera TaxID=397392 RepID=UPI0025ADD3BA|nr:uncharacterized protein LOC131157185 [Malania oleifera]XP_057967132.1 uncharacterized protein LOC131157185 [Malania oleifera]XP_057967133.1 uncharacterized protein LOC131157185 [Malania oleifera]XP_057967134.1 uncharacterized protein LOC131157185 [Malania oleifera]XP_057967135.1 uncharacterized protein LOC131157185 [Malania oleifera]
MKMDALQVIASATQIVSSMIGAVGALQQASRDLDEAPKIIRSLEDLVCDLENLTNRVKQKHVHKLHNRQLNHQIRSLESLIVRLHPNISKARKVVSKSRMKNFAKVVWNSMTGDPLGRIVNSMRDDLNWWFESQRLTENFEKAIESTAQNIPIRFKVNMEQGYPISSKCHAVRNLLEQESSHRVILIVGLSGIGKSCLARQVASDPPMNFVDGAVELGFGQWCSRASCNGSKTEYQKRLTRKICKFLVQIGFWKKIRDENGGDLEYVCCLLQEALYGKSILIVLDDVWEQDIVERFARLYDNDCRYLITTRNESVHEITEAEKVELSKDDIRGISKGILLYHTLLSEEELPVVAESLLERCGHHPLTVAVIGKALRKEMRAEKWERAITNLSTYATCAPGPVSYANEKEAESTVTIFGSFEFSLEAMPEDPRKLFITLAALSWDEPVPEACLEAIWSVHGQENLFPLVVCKLVEGSLLIKTDLYQVHDMMSLYLDGKMNDSVKILLTEPAPERIAFICPWLFIFGKETIRKIAEQKIVFFLSVLEEKQAVITLDSFIQALLASKSISEFEASRARISSILGPKIANLISTESQHLIATSAKAIANVFSMNDYFEYFPPLESIGAVDRLAGILENCEDPMIQTNISIVLAKLSEFGSPETVDKVLQGIPIGQLAKLLSPDSEEWHESVFTTFMFLVRAGKSKAVEKMFAFDVDKNLIGLLENGSEVAQHHAIVTLKAFYEQGGPPTKRSIQPGTLNFLPWQVRLSLERFVLSEQNITLSPKPQTFEDIMCKVLESDKKQVMEAMQDLIPFIEKAGEPRIRDMIIQSPLIKRLSDLLQHGQPEQNSIRSESAFLLMKLACSGGEPCTRKVLEYDIIPKLVKMMQCNVIELQDAAYSAIHQILFSNGGVLVLNRIVQMGVIDKLAHSIESKSIKTRELNVLCVLDIIELGNKACIEQMFSLQVVEKLVRIEKTSGGSGETLVGFLKGMDKCKHLTAAERRVMKQQVVRKVRVALKGHKFEAQILASLDACTAEGSRGSSSGSGKHGK